jgi:hypothetical protein
VTKKVVDKVLLVPISPRDGEACQQDDLRSSGKGMKSINNIIILSNSFFI